MESNLLRKGWGGSNKYLMRILLPRLPLKGKNGNQNSSLEPLLLEDKEMFSHCCENELLAPQQEAALRGGVLMNHRAKSPFLEGIIPSAFSNNSPRPQPDGCGVMALQ